MEMTRRIVLLLVAVVLVLGMSAGVALAAPEQPNPKSSTIDTVGGYNDATPVSTPGVKDADLNSTIQTTDTTWDNNKANANNTGSLIGTNDNPNTSRPAVIKSDGMVNNDGVTGTQRTHGEYQNNTNSCASCHQTHTAAAKNLLFKDGVYSTCTACHEIMKDAEGRTIADLQTHENPSTPGVNWTVTDAKAYMLDKNPSSALKRYTNMAVCWACHTSSKAEQLKNNSFYQSGDNEVPHGLQDTTLPTAPNPVTQFTP